MLNALRIGLLAVSLLFAQKAMAQDQVFLSVLDDVPLMAGLTESPDDSVRFDTPGGRIVEAYALGVVTKASVLSYYKDSLPSLGWKRTAHGHYMREGEYLTVSVKMENQTAIVHFSLSPNAN
ncbi:hypothetical protein RYZ26_14185 [Terasakiella sp. A23]|uniref:hypothetical protein n=1 Tax=Terasakiella sp. FCG-A23 TaxID=3080561 RepID=UPI0029538624|nr:hypothetical protein [Terasakiella sp. A23]MDV7340750.1 hypothetical protein [Terasakiella sp. A23]